MPAQVMDARLFSPFREVSCEIQNSGCWGKLGSECLMALGLPSLEVNEAFGHVHGGQAHLHLVADINSLRAPHHPAFGGEL